MQWSADSNKDIVYIAKLCRLDGNKPAASCRAYTAQTFGQQVASIAKMFPLSAASSAVCCSARASVCLFEIRPQKDPRLAKQTGRTQPAFGLSPSLLPFLVSCFQLLFADSPNRRSVTRTFNNRSVRWLWRSREPDKRGAVKTRSLTELDRGRPGLDRIQFSSVRLMRCERAFIRSLAGNDRRRIEQQG